MLNHIILGIVQGFTEFLPVSSSAHLVIMRNILGLRSEGLALFIILHLGTLCALVLFFFKDLLRIFKQPRIMLFILIVTVITGTIGIIGKDFFERLFSSPRLSALTLLATGALLLVSRIFKAKRKEPNFKDAIFLGISQAIAIIPGISRSGITIVSLLFRGLPQETAFRLSFLVSLPAIAGAAFLEMKDVSLSFTNDASLMAAGFLASLIAGVCALFALRWIMLRGKLHYFGYYCIALAVLVLIFMR